MDAAKRLSNTRKAYAALGDDTTLSRFVKIKHAGDKPPRRLQPRFHGVGVPAFVDQGRTKFYSTVKQPETLTKILSSGHNSVKIGRDVRKGHLRGYWIYYLTLEERKTCPTSCQHWQSCYGNNMPFAKRVDHTSPSFLPMLEAEIGLLCKSKYGVLIRLHALGDFYSPEYVGFWRRMLVKHNNLALFGYTARNNEDDIGPCIFKLRRDFGRRAMIRSSNGERHNLATVTIATEASCPPSAFICPEQTGRTACCATCGACWSTEKNVAFLEH
jgi:hypothetical protein